MKKEIAALSLTLALGMGLYAPAYAAETVFSDVADNHWAKPSITEMAERGVMTGVGNNQFAPENTTTYAEFITMVVRQFYEDKLGSGGDKWYSPSLSVAESVGILAGTNVSAEEVINRYEMAQIIYNVMKEQKMPTTSLSDTSKVADWSSIPAAYKDAVSVCYNMGMLSGVDGKGTFNGNGVMTRAQAAVVMDRLIGEEQVSPPPGAKPITEMSQLDRDRNGVEVYPGGFYLNPDRVSYGGSSISLTTEGYTTITLTFKAADKDTRITYGTLPIGAGLWDEPEEHGSVVVPAGETRVLSFDCSGCSSAGFRIERDDAVGNFASGWITNMYLS